MYSTFKRLKLCLKWYKDIDLLPKGETFSIPLYKNFFPKSLWCTEVYINPYPRRSLFHTHVYQHAWWRQYSDNGVRGHEYIWTLKHTESGLVFLVLSEVSMIGLIQYHTSEYMSNSNYNRLTHVSKLTMLELNREFSYMFPVYMVITSDHKNIL